MTILKIGLEKEFFLLKQGKPQVIPSGLPFDECGLLVEARGDASLDIVNAVYSLMADVYRIESKMAELDGRVEYRSLPSCIGWERLTDGIENAVKAFNS